MTRLHLSDQKHSKTAICSILLQFKITDFYFNIFQNVIYSCDGKAEFSAAITPVFSVTKIIQICSIGAQETFNIINVENSFFFQDSLIIRKFKRIVDIHHKYIYSHF